MAPTEFTQLFTLHSVLLGYTMPLIHALTIKGQEDTYRYTYEKVLLFAREEISTLTLHCIMSFEIANINVMQKLLSNAEVTV